MRERYISTHTLYVLACRCRRGRQFLEIRKSHNVCLTISFSISAVFISRRSFLSSSSFFVLFLNCCVCGIVERGYGCAAYRMNPHETAVHNSHQNRMSRFCDIYCNIAILSSANVHIWFAAG